MRTSIDLPDALFQQAKIASIHRGMSLRELINRALTRELAEPQAPQAPQRVQFPLIQARAKSRLKLDNAAIAQLEIEDDLSRIRASTD